MVLVILIAMHIMYIYIYIYTYLNTHTRTVKIVADILIKFQSFAGALPETMRTKKSTSSHCPCPLKSLSQWLPWSYQMLPALIRAIAPGASTSVLTSFHSWKKCGTKPSLVAQMGVDVNPRPRQKAQPRSKNQTWWRILGATLHHKCQSSKLVRTSECTYTIHFKFM